jgi:type VII secretion protein EccB
VPSRQDQLHSYQYAQQRVVAALVTHDPDPQRSPMRRAGSTVLISIVVAALAVAGALVYGLLTKSGTDDPKKEDVVFLERGTGARYVYVKSDGKMHPVLNYASGMLIASGESPTLQNVKREVLAQVPLGDTLGIAGAPDSLPDDGELVRNLWTVCSSQPADSTTIQSVLSIGDPVSGGTTLPVPRADTPPADLRGLLVSDPSNRTFLVYNNKRFLIPASRLQQIKVRFEYATDPLAVSAAWLNAVPIGPDLVPPSVSGRGAQSDAVPGFLVGQLLHAAEGGTERWGLVFADGRADITVVQAKLLQANGVTARDVTLNDYAAQAPSKAAHPIADATAAGLPPAVPVLLNGPDSVCLSYDGAADGKLSVQIGATVPTGEKVTQPKAVIGGVSVDQVHVERGKGAVVAVQSSPDAPAGSGTVSVITDTGMLYPLADRSVLSKLGYGGVELAVVPAQLVALLPQGPSLDPVAARKTAGTSSGD